MAALGVHQDFLHDLVRLDKPVQRKVADAVQKFGHATHAGMHLEKIDNARDSRLKSIRIDLFWRGIVLAPESGDSFTLLKVLQHDDAYDWARRRQVSVNSATGQIEIRDVVSIDETKKDLVKSVEDEPEPVRLFDHVSDEELARLGIDAQMRDFARILPGIELLEALNGKLPQTQYDVLIALAAGMTPDEVLSELLQDLAETPGEYDQEDVPAAVERTPSKVLFVDGPDELLELLRKPFALWRVYLHPTQRQVAFGRFSGPAQVIGGPGTGKTVVALHRARHLAAQGGRVLLTTFTSTLTGSLLDNLRLLETDAAVLSRIDVCTVDQVARQVVDRHSGRFALLDRSEEQSLWRRLLRARDLQYSETFLAEEWRQVVLAQDIRDLEGYLSARRVGRGRRLGRLQRTQVWRVISEFQNELTERRMRTYETVCTDAARLLADLDDKPYDHVVVDEAQDLHPVRWRLLRAAVTEGTDDLFIVGDTHQRIYDNRVSLKSVGIHIAGRTTRLSVNYRTTAEILAWSLGVLADEFIETLDDEPADFGYLLSEMHGRKPETVETNTKSDELRAFVTKVKSWLDAGVRPDEIGVCARSGPMAQDAVTALQKAGVQARHLTRERGSQQGHVQTMTMHRMKGLEFRCVALIGVGENQLPAPGAIIPLEEDSTSHRNSLQRERCLFFVACTRARESLYISWHGRRSPFLL